MQRIQGLQRREPRLAIFNGLENRQQTTTFFREPARFFGHHAAAINLNLKSKVTHGGNLRRRRLKRNEVPRLGRWLEPRAMVDVETFTRVLTEYLQIMAATILNGERASGAVPRCGMLYGERISGFQCGGRHIYSGTCD